MKRLFYLEYPSGIIFTDFEGGPYFDNKMKAKAVRDSFATESGLFLTVRKGPDHAGTHGDKKRNRNNRKSRYSSLARFL